MALLSGNMSWKQTVMAKSVPVRVGSSGSFLPVSFGPTDHFCSSILVPPDQFC